MNDGHVMSLFWNKGESGACAGRHGLHAESLHRLTDHWTHNEVIPSSRTIPVELIISCLTDLLSIVRMLAWTLQLRFL